MTYPCWTAGDTAQGVQLGEGSRQPLLCLHHQCGSPSRHNLSDNSKPKITITFIKEYQNVLLNNVKILKFMRSVITYNNNLETTHCHKQQPPSLQESSQRLVSPSEHQSGASSFFSWWWLQQWSFFAFVGLV